MSPTQHSALYALDRLGAATIGIWGVRTPTLRALLREGYVEQCNERTVVWIMPRGNPPALVVIRGQRTFEYRLTVRALRSLFLSSPPRYVP